MLGLGALWCTLLLGFILSEHTPSSFRFCSFCLSERGISWFSLSWPGIKAEFPVSVRYGYMGLQFSRKKQSTFHWQAPITEHSQRFKTCKNHWSPSWLRKLQIQFTSKLWIPGLSFPLSNFHELERLPLSCFSKKTNSFLFPEIFCGKQKISFLPAPAYQGTQKSTSKTKLSLVVDSSLVDMPYPFLVYTF